MMTDPPRTESGLAVVLVKGVHTAWFLVVSTSIVHIFVVGLSNRPSRWTAPALVATGLEVAVFLANAGRCPLTKLAENLGAQSGRVSDIFLPRWFADRIPQIYTPPLLIGVAALILHRWRRDRAMAMASA
jgi:hypothetical protein